MKDMDQKLQEMQILEHNLHNLLMQKQAFQMELSETRSALSELQNSDDEVYKIVGNLMIKSSKTNIKEDLTNKEKLLELRLKSLDKQESAFSQNIEKIREELISSNKK